MSKPDIWVDGSFVRWDDATVHVLSHSFQRGSTVFESLSCEETEKGPAIFRLEEHVDRFFGSGRLTGMQIPFSREELIEAVRETVRRSGLARCCIRPLAFYVGDELKVVPEHSVVRVIIAVAEAPEEPDTLRAKVSSVRKLHPDTVPVAAKVAANYLGGMLAKREALAAGFDEAILLDTSGNVSECPTKSFCVVTEGEIRTAPLGAVLAGITRDSVLQIARDLGYRVTEVTIPLADLYGADEVFAAGTGPGVVPIVQVDERKIGQGEPGEITTRLRKAYMNAAAGKDMKYEHWLTYVR